MFPIKQHVLIYVIDWMIGRKRNVGNRKDLIMPRILVGKSCGIN